MNECKLVEDLLPLYAEELVSEETRDFVEQHCAGCERCEQLRSRTRQDLQMPGLEVDYKKDLRKSVWWIIGKSIVATVLIFGLWVYGLWEMGMLDKQVYQSPDGSMRFEVVDFNAGLVKGRVSIATPDGRGREIYGDEGFEGFKVWFSPDSKAYFVWIEFEDHDETYLMVSRFDEDLQLDVATYYPSFEIEERDFLAVLKGSEQGQKYLYPEDTVITFDRWSEDGQTMFFNYQVPNAWTGEIIYDVASMEVKEITCYMALPLTVG